MRSFCLTSFLRNAFSIGALLFLQAAFCQADSLVFDSGKNLVGEIKKMERGILEIKTSYSKETFKIKWNAVKRIYTQGNFKIKIKNQIVEGKITSSEGLSIQVYQNDRLIKQGSLEDVVFINRLKEGFSDRFNAAVEFGFNLTKAQNFKQYSIRSSAGYITKKSKIDIAYNLIRSSQEDAETVRRNDGLLNYRRLLFNNWYAIATISTLSNTEQKIDIRANTQVGVGNYIFSTNSAYWGLKTGLNNNLEQFTNETVVRSSWESFVGTDLNLYDIGDLQLKLIAMSYLGMTESGRFRSDISFDATYDLPFNLFYRLGIELNYDNKPAVQASETDYIFRTGIGWKW